MADNGISQVRFDGTGGNAANGTNEKQLSIAAQQAALESFKAASQQRQSPAAADKSTYQSPPLQPPPSFLAQLPHAATQGALIPPPQPVTHSTPQQRLPAATAVHYPTLATSSAAVERVPSAIQGVRSVPPAPAAATAAPAPFIVWRLKHDPAPTYTPALGENFGMGEKGYKFTLDFFKSKYPLWTPDQRHSWDMAVSLGFVAALVPGILLGVTFYCAKYAHYKPDREWRMQTICESYSKTMPHLVFAYRYDPKDAGILTIARRVPLN